MNVVMPPEFVKRNSSGWTVTRKGTGTKFGAKLNDVVNYLEKQKMYPTPKTADYKDISYKPTWKLGDNYQKTLPREVLKNNKTGGRLNPNFVEFLMGFPMDWTRIDQIE